ncbi:MAG TPA: DEAD/DEAH box helicase, partial [Thermoleophilaceae bacterium]|nr:DEAD/DEAH box helicase [Thermoleophilaceae bacterium]
MARLRTSRAPWEEVLEPARGEQLVRTARYGSRREATAPVPEGLHPELAAALSTAGVDELYSHQAETFESALQGHTIVTTGTASGKSLAFNLPVLETLARDRRARALYLYPTKALAQDQARGLSELRPSYLRHAIYDGDTPR